MAIRPGLLYVVCLLSVVLFDPFESPGVGEASFPPTSPQDFESAVLVNTPRVACCHEGEFELTFDGDTYVAQRAEHLGTGTVRVYYVKKPVWDDVQCIERG